MIAAITDNDLYKFTMQKAVLDCFPGTPVKYQFFNRRPSNTFDSNFLDELKEQLRAMESLELCEDEYDFLMERCPFLGEPYLKWLKDYRFNSDEVNAKIVDNQLSLEINGTWERTILWEVPLMALISEIYFKKHPLKFSDYLAMAMRKGASLEKEEVVFTDFGTRRRRSFAIQSLIVEAFTNFQGFMGTSNVYLAKRNNIKPLGTMAHEWIMGISALEGLRHANRYAMKHWSHSYKGNLGTALTDTFGTAAFWEDFDSYYARLFDSVRHDSGDPFKFGESAIRHYKTLSINPMHRTIIFSDGLDTNKAIELKRYFKGKINTSFGIGTHFTNDVPDSPALNMVIKMIRCGGIPVVKLSDTPSKSIGDRDALRVANWTFFHTPLD